MHNSIWNAIAVNRHYNKMQQLHQRQRRQWHLSHHPIILLLIFYHHRHYHHEYVCICQWLIGVDLMWHGFVYMSLICVCHLKTNVHVISIDRFKPFWFSIDVISTRKHIYNQSIDGLLSSWNIRRWTMSFCFNSKLRYSILSSNSNDSCTNLSMCFVLGSAFYCTRFSIAVYSGFIQ